MRWQGLAREHPEGMTNSQHRGLRALFAEDRLPRPLLPGRPPRGHPDHAPPGHPRPARRGAGVQRLPGRAAGTRASGTSGRSPPWVYLGHVAALTRKVALVTGAIVLRSATLHVAKAAAPVDRLSGGRFVLGVATGDRPAEAVAFGVDPASRGSLPRARSRPARRLVRSGEHLPGGASGAGSISCPSRLEATSRSWPSDAASSRSTGSPGRRTASSSYPRPLHLQKGMAEEELRRRGRRERSAGPVAVHRPARATERATTADSPRMGARV